MIEFRHLSDDHPDLQHSPLLRAAMLTLNYAQQNGSISLTKTKSFKRVFAHWAAEHFAWPDQSIEQLLRYRKALNEQDFLPLELLHYLLVRLKLGRHIKVQFRVTRRGLELAQSPGRLFAELIPFYLLRLDHSAYSGIDEPPFGKWDVWLNVINMEADHGSTERMLYSVFYGEEADWDNAGWREMAAFSSCVLKPLEWAGFMVQQQGETTDGKHVHHQFKTPLWRSVLKLDLDDPLRPPTLQ